MKPDRGVSLGRRVFGLRLSPWFLPILCALMLLINPRVAQTIEERKYSPMSEQEARQYVEELIKRREVPPPPGSDPVFRPGSWKPPASGFYARGVRINDNDYLVFAAVEPSYEMTAQKGSLPNLVPRLARMFYDYDRRLFVEGKAPESANTAIMPFVVNGIFFSTADIEVGNQIVLTRDGPDWKAAGPLIKKGGYVWWVGPVGILLERRGATRSEADVLLAFHEPIMNFSFSPPPLDLIDLIIVKAPAAGVVTRFRNKDISLK